MATGTTGLADGLDYRVLSRAPADSSPFDHTVPIFYGGALRRIQVLLVPLRLELISPAFIFSGFNWGPGVFPPREKHPPKPTIPPPETRTKGPQGTKGPKRYPSRGPVPRTPVIKSYPFTFLAGHDPRGASSPEKWQQ